MTAAPIADIGWAGRLAVPWGLGGVTFWILLTLLVVVLVRGLRTAARPATRPAVHLLEERYARGEITREDFLERRTVLTERPPSIPVDDAR
jgi:putative membrane protein